MVFFVVFFFFKQKTAYEMRISDWSSDVCSSDLEDALHAGRVLGGGLPLRAQHAAPDLQPQPRVSGYRLRPTVRLYGTLRPDHRRPGAEAADRHAAGFATDQQQANRLTPFPRDEHDHPHAGHTPQQVAPAPPATLR